MNKKINMWDALQDHKSKKREQIITNFLNEEKKEHKKIEKYLIFTTIFLFSFLILVFFSIWIANNITYDIIKIKPTPQTAFYGVEKKTTTPTTKSSQNQQYVAFCDTIPRWENGGEELTPGNYHGVQIDGQNVTFPWNGFQNSHEWCYSTVSEYFTNVIFNYENVNYYICEIYQSVNTCNNFDEFYYEMTEKGEKWKKKNFLKNG